MQGCQPDTPMVNGGTAGGGGNAGRGAGGTAGRISK